MIIIKLLVKYKILIERIVSVHTIFISQDSRQMFILRLFKIKKHAQVCVNKNQEPEPL